MKLTVTNQNGSDNTTETVVVTVLEAPTATHDCDDQGNLMMTATGGGNTFNWYDAATGGTLLHSGSTYSPTVNGPTSFWVEETKADPPVNGGPKTPASVGGGGYFGTNDTRGIFLDVLSDATIKSVYVDATGAGTRTIELLDGDGGNVLQTKDVNLADGGQRVTLDFPVTVGTGYYLKVTGTLVDLYRNTDGATYPYNIGGLISLTGNNYTDQGYYYYFYDFEVEKPGCTGPRSKIDVDVCNVGIDGTAHEDFLKLYPNPAHDVLYYENTDAANRKATINIYTSATGQLVRTLSAGNAKGSIDLGQLSKGMYFVQIYTENEILTTKKLVIQ
ncbi:MAG: T9SS type A sorting domain-containing protein [Flavobacteriales bacterium]|nr:T9SS type A sorting domain-containing protein [Flavobacteriales bacterium]